MDLKTVEIDPDLEEAGTWMDYEDAQFRVRSERWPPYAKAIQAKIRALGRKSRNGEVDVQELQEKHAPALVVKHLLVDWRNVKLDGKELAFSPEKAAEVLIPRFINVVHRMRRHADTEANYYFKEVEDAAGKLELVSNSS